MKVHNCNLAKTLVWYTKISCAYFCNILIHPFKKTKTKKQCGFCSGFPFGRNKIFLTKSVGFLWGYVSFQQTISFPVFDVRNSSLVKNFTIIGFHLLSGFQWQPTPVLLPGKSHGRRSLVGCRLWGRTVGHDWSDLAAAAVTMIIIWDPGWNLSLMQS